MERIKDLIKEQTMTEKIKELSTDEIKRRLEAALRLNKSVPGLRALAYQDALRKRSKKEKS